MISELEKSEKIDKNLLRYLTVKVKEFDLTLITLKKTRSKKAIIYEKNKKRNTQSNFSKLSIFQPNKFKFKKKCPLSIKVLQKLITKILNY